MPIHIIEEVTCCCGTCDHLAFVSKDGKSGSCWSRGRPWDHQYTTSDDVCDNWKQKEA